MNKQKNCCPAGVSGKLIGCVCCACRWQQRWFRHQWPQPTTQATWASRWRSWVRWRWAFARSWTRCSCGGTESQTVRSVMHVQSHSHCYWTSEPSGHVCVLTSAEFSKKTLIIAWCFCRPRHSAVRNSALMGYMCVYIIHNTHSSVHTHTCTCSWIGGGGWWSGGWIWKKGGGGMMGGG